MSRASPLEGSEVASVSRSKRNRTHASLSCYPCRSRKHKCDGQRPICACCVVARTECSWPRYDGRRTIPISEHWEIVQRLHRHIEHLTQLLLSAGVQPPASPPVPDSTVPFSPGPQRTRRTSLAPSAGTAGSPPVGTDAGSSTPLIGQPTVPILSSWLHPALMQRQNHALHVGSLSPYVSPASFPAQNFDVHHSPYMLATREGLSQHQLPASPAQSLSDQADHFEVQSGSARDAQGSFGFHPAHVLHHAVQQHPNAQRSRAQGEGISALARLRQTDPGMPPFAFQFSRH